MTTGDRIDGRNAHRIDIVRDVLTTQHVDRMHGQGDVSIPTAIVSYGFRNLFRNEKRYEDDFPLRRARAMAVWKRCGNVTQTCLVRNRHDTGYA